MAEDGRLHLTFKDDQLASTESTSNGADTSTLLVARRTAVLGEAWLERCRMADVTGMSKLVRKIETEVTFLKNLIDQQGEVKIKMDQVRSSNLSHLQAVAHAAFTVPNVTAVLLSVPIRHQRKRLIVDVVGNNGNTFVKVIASNRRTHSEDADATVRFGEKTLVHQASEYIACSQQNPIFYRAPSVEFIFYVHQVAKNISHELQAMNVTVRIFNEVVLASPPPPLPDISSPIDHSECPSELSRLNLDVSCMIAYVSALTNGRANFVFAETVLTEQAQCERRHPVKPQLDAWFKGRQLLSCTTAITDYKKIVATVGGKQEKERAARLLERLTVVDDCLSGPLVDSLQSQSDRPRIKKRSLTSVNSERTFNDARSDAESMIFGTGETLRAATITANRGFIRSADSKGVHFAVLMHESRALTEAKEETAKEI